MTSHSCKISTHNTPIAYRKKKYFRVFRCAFFSFILRRIFVLLLSTKMRYLISQAKTILSDAHWHVTKPIYTFPISCAHILYGIWVCVFTYLNFCVSLSLSVCISILSTFLRTCIPVCLVYSVYRLEYNATNAWKNELQQFLFFSSSQCMSVEYPFAILAQLHIYELFVLYFVFVWQRAHIRTHTQRAVSFVRLSFFLCLLSSSNVVFPRFSFLSAFARTWNSHTVSLYHHHCCLPWFKWMNSYKYAHEKGTHIHIRIHNYK